MCCKFQVKIRLSDLFQWGCGHKVYFCIEIHFTPYTLRSHADKQHMKFKASIPLNAAKTNHYSALWTLVLSRTVGYSFSWCQPQCSTNVQTLREHCPRFSCYSILQCHHIQDEWWEGWESGTHPNNSGMFRVLDLPQNRTPSTRHPLDLCHMWSAGCSFCWWKSILKIL